MHWWRAEYRHSRVDPRKVPCFGIRAERKKLEDSFQIGKSQFGVILLRTLWSPLLNATDQKERTETNSAGSWINYKATREKLRSLGTRRWKDVLTLACEHILYDKIMHYHYKTAFLPRYPGTALRSGRILTPRLSLPLRWFVTWANCLTSLGLNCGLARRRSWCMTTTLYCGYANCYPRPVGEPFV